MILTIDPIFPGHPSVGVSFSPLEVQQLDTLLAGWGPMTIVSSGDSNHGDRFRPRVVGPLPNGHEHGLQMGVALTTY